MCWNRYIDHISNSTQTKWCDFGQIRSKITSWCRYLFNLFITIGIFPYDTIDVEIQTRGTLQRNTTTSTIYNLTPLERPLKRISSEVRTQPASKRRSPFLFEIVQGIEQMAREPIVIDYELEEMCKRGKRTISMIIETNN